eukprot:418241_1
MDRYQLLIQGYIRISMVDYQKNDFILNRLPIIIIKMLCKQCMERVNIRMEGWLLKKSKHLGIQRKRWVVLDGLTSTITTYKKKKMYNNPTEAINLHVFQSVKGSEEGIYGGFDVYNSEEKITFIAENNIEKLNWFNKIGKAIILTNITAYH